MRSAIIIIFFMFSCLYAFANEHTDSLMMVLDENIEAKNFNNEVFMIAFEIGNHLASEDIDKAFDFNYRMQSLASEIDNDTLKNIVFINFANLYKFQGFYDKAFENYYKAAFYSKTNDSGAYTWNLVHLGNLYYRTGLINEAIEKYKESIEVSRNHYERFEKENSNIDSIRAYHYHYALAVCYNNIGLCKIKLNEIEKARENFSKAKANREKTDSKIGMAYQYYYQAMLYNLENKKEEAMNDIETALTTIELAISENRTDYFNKIIAKTDFLFLQTEIFFDRNKIDSVYNTFDKIIILLNDISNNRDRLYLTLFLAQMEIDNNMHSIAERRLKQIIKESDKSKYNSIKQEAYLTLARLYEKTNNPGKANETYQKHNLFRDSIQFQQDSTDYKWIEKSVINEMKAQQIELMQKNKLLNQEKIKNQNILITFLISITILILLILIILYRNQIINKKTNRKLAKSESELKNAIITKDKFLSIIAHDLKSPLSSFTNSLELIYNYYENMSNEERKEFIDELHKSSRHLLELLENLLIWSRTQNDTIPYNPETVSVKSVADNVISLLFEFAKGKQITLKNEIPENIKITADINMLNTILRNLISNAIKFSEANSSIIIGMQMKDGKTEFFVRDFGMGIPEDKIDDVIKLDNTYSTLGTNNEKGTGLGLVLCNEFAQRHNGYIRIESKLNEGTTIFFTLE